MKDAFHGSAHPAHGLVTASRGSTLTLVHPYRGSTRTSRRRGTARTAPVWIRRAGAHCADRLPRIVLEVDAAWAAIPCWSGRASRWAHSTVTTAYTQRYDTHVRPVMPHNPVSAASRLTTFGRLPVSIFASPALVRFENHPTVTVSCVRDGCQRRY